MKKTISNGLLIAIILIAIGLILGFLGMTRINDYKDKQTYYKEVTAKVIDYKTPGEKSGGSFAVYEYKVNGKTYTATSDIKSSILPRIGTTKKIMYNPLNPEEVLFGGSNYLLLIIGIVFIVVGILAMIKTIFLKKSSKNIEFDNTNINDVTGPNNI